LAELNAGELIDGDEVLAWLDLDSAKSLRIYRRSGSWLRAITWSGTGRETESS